MPCNHSLPFAQSNLDVLRTLLLRSKTLICYSKGTVVMCRVGLHFRLRWLFECLEVAIGNQPIVALLAIVMLACISHHWNIPLYAAINQL